MAGHTEVAKGPQRINIPWVIDKPTCRVKSLSWQHEGPHADAHNNSK